MVQHRVNLFINPIERKALKNLAAMDFRSMNDEIRFIVCAELKRRGLLPEDSAAARPLVEAQS